MPIADTEFTLPSTLSDLDLHNLNVSYVALDAEERIAKFYQDFGEEKTLLSSSFGTTSAVLLKMVSEVCPSQKITFIDTGFHFPETIKYKEKLTSLMNLTVDSVFPDPEKTAYIKRNRLWESDPEQCTQINKIAPFQIVKSKHTMWISGVMRWQTPHRKTMQIFERNEHLVKFHPLLDVTESEKNQYFSDYNLPHHPLFFEGYDSVGCIHCTKPGKNREGRLELNAKKECGLHL